MQKARTMHMDSPLDLSETLLFPPPSIRRNTMVWPAIATSAGVEIDGDDGARAVSGRECRGAGRVPFTALTTSRVSMALGYGMAEDVLRPL